MIMPRGQPLLLPVPPGFIALTLVLGLMINMLPLGRALWLPDVLLLVLVYWGVHEPGKIGMGWAFVLGLCMDVHQSSLLGLHALVYSAVLYGVALLRQRITWLSVMAQAVQVMPLFLASDVVLMLLRMLLRGSFPGWGFLTPGLWCVVLWPLVSWLLQLPQRQPPDDDENRPL
ncbi:MULTISPECIES: rod shape-determining protein MreD [Comamonas]|jgi:rod shape-determining protein MreD|uniref:Rod shape-determining protein MreD n=1 Tax=Comamonas squillarum TaxID=2977320 RepID=A0ABY5ZWA0_9BURK|nr:MULTISPECIES: rod shape-determining protein MreD [Comamonas]PWB16890.1 rod shape-determining protein MreD [Comamonas sp. JNW]UXC17015.1 rod shape-determining protein MreD [Comamonas sp. PR12]